MAAKILEYLISSDIAIQRLERRCWFKIDQTSSLRNSIEVTVYFRWAKYTPSERQCVSTSFGVLKMSLIIFS